MNPEHAVKISPLYTGQVKRVTAHEARENLFQLLDEVVGGEVVIIDKDGTPLTLQRQESSLVENVPEASSAVAPHEDTDTREVIRRIKELRKHNRLDGLSIQEMKEEGRG